MALRIYDDVLDLVRQTKPVLDRVSRHDADLARQGRRAMTSAPLNIAEGARQRGGLGRARFENAMGSADETRAVLQTAAAAGYIEDQVELVEAWRGVAKQLSVLMRR